MPAIGARTTLGSTGIPAIIIAKSLSYFERLLNLAIQRKSKTGHRNSRWPVKVSKLRALCHRRVLSNARQSAPLIFDLKGALFLNRSTLVAGKPGLRAGGFLVLLGTTQSRTISRN